MKTKEQKKIESDNRNTVYRRLSIPEKICLLDQRGLVAAKQRAKLSK